MEFIVILSLINPIYQHTVILACKWYKYYWKHIWHALSGVQSTFIAHVHLEWLYYTYKSSPVNSTYRIGQCSSRSFFQLTPEAYTGPSKKLSDLYGITWGNRALHCLSLYPPLLAEELHHFHQVLWFFGVIRWVLLNLSLFKLFSNLCLSSMLCLGFWQK